MPTRAHARGAARVIAWLPAAAMLACLLPLARAQAPFSFDGAPGRLPKNVVPQSYAIAVTPDVAHMSIAGRETVLLQFRSATPTIQFNTLNETLADVRLDGRAVQDVHTDNARQLTTVTLAAAAPAGLHRLTLAYTGRIETGAVGLFLQHYTDTAGHRQFMLSTQMEATDARRMFPCWDEPAFRATFRLTVTVPADWATVSNMPVASRQVNGALATTTFRATPRMPSYLVEFSAGDLRRIGAGSGSVDAGSRSVDFGVWAVNGREQDGAVALANARQILADYDTYFAYPYPLPKLDSIAIPGGFSGAMENWGAITYQENALLLPPTSTLDDRQLVYATQAHEMAHQWNGDLVTMGWWDDLWLNESFASWMAAKETALRHPQWHWWEVEDADKETAMAADAQTSSQAIEQHVTDELQASNAFDPSITYNKGQSVLRMFEEYLGPAVFRDGIRRYIRARAYSNATAGDLWRALSAASGRNMAAIAAPWTQQPGFPLVTVAAHCASDGARTLSLSQQRFLLRGQASGGWQVPLQIRVGATGTPHAVLLTRDGQTLAAGSCSEALSLDAGAVGFYRVRYDAATLAADTRHFGELPDGDRIALLDDQWALVEAGGEPLASYLALPPAMGDDLDSRAWRQITAALETIETDERGTPGHDAFAAYARSIIAPLVQRLGWQARPGETPDVGQLRDTLLLDLGSWGDQAVIGAARQRFAALLADPHALSPDTQQVVLSLAALHADQRTFDRLHELARHAGDAAARERDYAALALVRDPQLARQVVQIALSDEIPPQDAQLRLAMVARLTGWHPQLAWAAFSAHIDALLAPYGTFVPLFTAQYLPEWFWNALPPEQLEAWVRARVPAEMAPAVARGMQAVHFNLSEKAALVPAADAYVRAAAAASRPRARPAGAT